VASGARVCWTGGQSILVTEIERFSPMKVIHGEARRREVDVREGAVDQRRLKLDQTARYQVPMGSSWWHWWPGLVLREAGAGGVSTTT
jgi:hypothetical protein